MFLFSTCPSFSRALELQPAESFRKIFDIPQSLLNLAEIAVGASSVLSHKGVCCWLTISSIKFNGDDRGISHRRNFASASAGNGDGNKKPRSFEGKGPKPSDQEEIIALLRRIRVSLSKDKIDGSDKTSSDSYKKATVESIIDVLRESERQNKGEFSSGERKKNWTKRRGISSKEREVQEHPRVTTGFKLTRLPSNFEKKSPIPYLSTPRGRVHELNNEPLSATVESTQEQTERLEEMKLPELKELAKSRGFKGYSKLKKGELVEMLRS